MFYTPPRPHTGKGQEQPPEFAVGLEADFVCPPKLLLLQPVGARVKVAQLVLFVSHPEQL